MAGPQASGPISFWVSYQTPVKPVFLGYGETGPDDNEELHYEPVRSDLAGSALPEDELYMGKDANINITLTHWHEAGLDMLVAGPGRLIGRDNVLDRGALMGRGKGYLRLWMRYEHRTDPVMVAAGMAPGKYYFNVRTQGPIRSMRGRRANRIAINLHCHNGRDATDGVWKLYSENIAAVANLNIDSFA